MTTIYAVQDMTDDRAVGVKSSALGLGQYLRHGVAMGLSAGRHSHRDRTLAIAGTGALGCRGSGSRTPFVVASPPNRCCGPGRRIAAVQIEP